MNSITKSVDCAPICNPKLAPQIEVRGSAPAADGAAAGDAAPPSTADDESSLEHRWEDRDALGFLQQVLRNALVGCVHDLAEDSRCLVGLADLVVEVLLGLCVRDRADCQREAEHGDRSEQ